MTRPATTTTKATTAKAARAPSTPVGIQAAEAAFDILRAMLDASGPLPLKDIAAGAGMAPSNVHRYLVSFVRVGVVVQDPVTARYDLGPLALRMGLSALSRLDGVDVLAAGLSELVETTGIDAHSTTWGNAGPVVLRWRGQPGGITVRVQEGTVLPIMGSATGRTWAAHLPRAVVQPLLDVELAARAKSAGEPRAQVLARFEERLELVRRSGVERSSGERRAGINTACVPVFGADGRIAYALTLLAPVVQLDGGIGEEAVAQLQRSAQALSHRLGARLPAP